MENQENQLDESTNYVFNIVEKGKRPKVKEHECTDKEGNQDTVKSIKHLDSSCIQFSFKAVISDFNSFKVKFLQTSSTPSLFIHTLGIFPTATVSVKMLHELS